MMSGVAGTLVDLSEYGALLDLPRAGNIGSYAEFDLHWEGIPFRLQGRVVRCSPIVDSERAGGVAPTTYHVAIEFDLESRYTVRLQDLMRRAREEMR